MEGCISSLADIFQHCSPQPPLCLSHTHTETQMHTRLLDVLLWFLRVFPSSQTLSVITVCVCVCVFERKRGRYTKRTWLDMLGPKSEKRLLSIFYNKHNNLSEKLNWKIIITWIRNILEFSLSLFCFNDRSTQTHKFA